MSQSIQVLVVEDEVITGRVISEELALLGYAVTDVVFSDTEAIESVTKSKPDLVLMDIFLKGSQMDGIEVATLLRQEFQLPVIYITAHTDDATLERARHSEPYGYLVKPFDERDLRVAIETATYKHRMELQLARREAQLSAILTSTSDAVIATDQRAEVTYMNPAAEKLTGWQGAEALGKDVAEVLMLVDAQSGEPIAHPVPYVLQSGQVSYLSDNTAAIDRQGTKKPVGDSASPIFMPSGTIDGAVMVLWDMSDRKRTEAALLESESRFRNAFETAAVGMALNAPDGRFLKVNAALCGILGYTESELLQMTFQDITFTDDLPADLDATARLLNGEVSSFNLEKRFWHKQKYLIWTLLSVSLVRDTNEAPLYLIAQIQNISDRKESEHALFHLNQKLEHLNQELEDRVSQRTEALQQSEARLIATNERLEITNEELARATRLKDAFLANMSHELRTPLTAILGMTESLIEEILGQVNPEQLKSLQTIERSGTHLLELINDILDVAKADSGQMDLAYTLTPVEVLCQSSLAFIKQQALKKNIEIESQLAPNLPNLFIDERRIRQVLINLLNNAVKFTPEGGHITLAVNYAPDALSDTGLATNLDPRSHLRFSVIDTGIGIAPENIGKLFQPFIQIDNALNRQYQGTGLGLALVKRLVELHGGQVSLISQLGVGSCFIVDLPCTTSALPMLEPETQSPYPESRQPLPGESGVILLVEDSEANISMMQSYLTAKGYRILVARNGEEAIALAQSDQPNLILMDIQLPGMDGLEATRQIRSNEQLAPVPIIALTALAMPGDQDRCLAAGANYYLSKPVKLRHLLDLIQRCLAV